MSELDLREQLAAIEHERWADWQKWMHKQMSDAIMDGKAVFTLPVEAVVAWERQIQTPYAKLSDKEKASDMEQVDRYWPLITQAKQESYDKAIQDVRDGRDVDDAGDGGATEYEAERQAMLRDQRAYKCDYCSHYHLTTQPNQRKDSK
jgi:hypothetical protein